ncbi:MAG TPA: nucleotide exchange factor GrpE [Fimbriimonadales bacterium]|jgi:molecular chaperone GrpE|nr:nucleotide exchange factor GrpE [Fimbriimonadales bacterium]
MEEDEILDEKAADEQPQESDSVADLEGEIESLKRQVAAEHDALLRAMADLQNYKRRSAQDVLQARETGAAGLAERLLPVLDNFERTVEAAEKGTNVETLVAGIKIVDKQLRAALEEYHVRAIPAVGMPFDPEIHEAVASEPSEHEEGTVIGEVEKGYAMGKKVLRPTKARVSKGKKH